MRDQPSSLQDNFCRSLINEFGKPLITTFANVNGEPLPANFGAISSEIIQGVDYVAKYRQKEKFSGQPSVMVKLTEKNELVFIRE